MIKNILIVGGTHGNELTGIHSVKHLQSIDYHKQFSDLTIDYLLANPKAIQANQRYIDKDLNRSFKLSDLNDQSLTHWEAERAKEINSQYGPKKENPKVDFVIDLHTTTTNMQTNIVLTRTDEFHLKLAAFIKSRLPDVVITSEGELMDDHHFLESIAEKGVLIEIGPIAQGTVDYNILKLTLDAIEQCLKFVELCNNAQMPSEDDLGSQVEIMNYHGKVQFPLNKQGEISACVHPNLIGKAYPFLNTGEPLFIDFFGNEVAYAGEPTHLAFVNEAAYYDQNIAACLCRPKLFSLTEFSETND